MAVQEETRYGEVPGTQKTPGKSSNTKAPLPPSAAVWLQGGHSSMLDETRRAQCQTPWLGCALTLSHVFQPTYLALFMKWYASFQWARRSVVSSSYTRIL